MNYLRLINFLFLKVCGALGGAVLRDSHLVSAIHQRECYYLILLFHFVLLCCLHLFGMSNLLQAKESGVMILILFLVVRYD